MNNHLLIQYLNQPFFYLSYLDFREQNLNHQLLKLSFLLSFELNLLNLVFQSTNLIIFGKSCPFYFPMLSYSHNHESIFDSSH